MAWTWKPEDLSLAIRFLRALRGWTQTELARAAGMDKSRISLMESGDVVPDRALMQRLSAAASFPFVLLEICLPLLRSLQQAGREGLSAKAGDEIAGSVETVTGELARATRAIATKAVLALSVASREPEWSYRVEDRNGVEELFRILAPCKKADRLFLITEGREYRNWALAEKFCAESEKAASNDLERALDFSETALEIACSLPGPEGFRFHVQGYCWGFLGNVRRVASDLPAAEQAFLKAWKLWREWVPTDSFLLQESRLLDLEASLRRDQRQLNQSLSLLQRALKISLPDARPALLLKRSHTEKLLGDPKRAITTLRRADALLAEQRGTQRLRFAVSFNLAANLLDLARTREAEKLLPGVRSQAEAIGNGLDLLRVDWLEALAAAARRRPARAVASLEKVRDAFAGQGIAYDAALVSLDLAIVLLGQGRHAEVRGVAEEMLRIFQAQQVAPEALASVRLFCEATRREVVTVEIARQVKQDLERAGKS
jgi:transcriptional regulator with XRE-family HTH domain